MRESILNGQIAIFIKLHAHGPNRLHKLVPELRWWENKFLRPNRNFHEIGCLLPKSAEKRSPSSDNEKMYFYGRIAIFMKLGAHHPNQCTSGPQTQIMRKSIFTAEIAIFYEIGCSRPKSALRSGPRAQIMRESIFTAESQFSWNWLLTAQIDLQAVP